MPTMEDLSSKLETMSEPSLNASEIAGLFRCPRTIVGKIKRAAIKENDGGVRFNPRVVRTEAVFAVQEMDRAREMDAPAESIRKITGAEGGRAR